MTVEWSKIGTGPKFNALYSALLRQSDPAAKIFNRDGKDGGIDALSGDGKTVYQSKYHLNGTSGLAFTDANRELEKVPDRRDAADRWYETWKNVDRWCLVTNVPFGPQDEQRWQAEVVPMFAALGLKAIYKTSADLGLELIEHRDIAEAFFGDRPRLFVSLAEHRDDLLGREVLARSYDLPFEGRVAELATIRGFVESSTHHVLLIEGPGGVGKSRLQYEAAKALLDAGVVDTVYCGTKHLPANPNWYVGIQPEARALVIIDDPTDADFVLRFLAEMRSRTQAWKAVITVRTHRDPVVACLKDPRERLLAPPLVVLPLAESAAIAVARDLLGAVVMPEDERRRAEKWLVRVCGRFPIWMTVAVQLLECGDRRDFSEDTFDIARKYLQEILHNTALEIATPAQTLAVLRWIAIAQPVNRHIDGVLAYVAAAAGLPSAAHVERLLVDLSRRRVVTLFGIDKRMVEVRPDVVRDHLLVSWLTTEEPTQERRPSPEARQLALDLAREAVEERPSPLVVQVVRSLARLEFLTDARLPLLDPIADAAVGIATSAGDTRTQRRALDLAAMWGPFRPGSLARVATLIRTRVVPVSGNEFLGWTYPIPRERIVADLPWELYQAAHGATQPSERMAILRELLELVDLEPPSETQRHRTGRSAAELLPRILHERHGYRSSFLGEATRLANDFLAHIARGEAPRESWRALIAGLTTLEHRDAYVSEDDSNTFTFEHGDVDADSQFGRVAIAVREKLWGIVFHLDGMTPAKRLTWPILDAMHGSLNRASAVPEWRALVLDDLRRCQALVERGSGELSELQAARRIWEWHVQYDESADARPLADECEAAYCRRPAITQFAGVFGTNRIDVNEVIDAAADAWPTSSSAADLEGYLRGARHFAETHADQWRSHQVLAFALRLGFSHYNATSVCDFVAAHLRRDSDLFQYASKIVHGSLFAARQRGDTDVQELLTRVDVLLPDSESRSDLLANLYLGDGRVGVRAWTSADRDFMERHWSVFEALPTRSLFFLLGRRLYAEQSLLGRAANAFGALEESVRGEALAALWSGYCDALSYPLKAEQIAEPVVDFLLDLMFRQPDIDAKYGNLDWNIKEVLRLIPKKVMSWTLGMVRTRLELFRERCAIALESRALDIPYILPPKDSLLWHAIEKVANSVPSSELVATFERLFDLARSDERTLRFLPEFANTLDPHGQIVPDFIATRIADMLTTPDVDAIVDLDAFGGWYAINSVPWRKIAIAACQRIDATWSQGDRYSIYSSLRSQRMQSWSGSFRDKRQSIVDVTRAALNAETVHVLQIYWTLELERAEVNLRSAEAHAEEGHD